MIWEDIQDEIQATVQDPSFNDGGKYADYLMKWGNRILVDLASKLYIPQLSFSANFTTVSQERKLPLPSDFHKVDKDTSLRVGDVDIPYLPYPHLRSFDPAHSVVSGDSRPAYWSVKNEIIYVYPGVNCTYHLNHYYRLPNLITGDGSVIDLPEVESAKDLLVAGVSLRCFRWLEEFGNTKDDSLVQEMKNVYNDAILAFKDYLWKRHFVGSEPVSGHYSVEE